MEKIKSTSLYSGLSGLQLNIPKYLFPEPFQNVSRLTYYSTLFNSIEINSSFYKIPQEKTVSNWAISVSSNFKFTFKLWREITHTKEMDFNQEFASKFFKSINAVNEKKGCLLIQFPPFIGNKYFTKLENILNYIKDVEDNNWKVAVEFRNESWYNSTTYDLLNDFNAGLVLHDKTKSATPMVLQDSDFVYVRFHGPTGNYRESYSDDYLSEYGSYVNEWRSQNKTVFMYFNNTMGDAFNNLNSINKILANKVDLLN